MADETAEFQLSCVHCEAKDFNTGRCRIAPRIIEKIGGKIKSPVPLTLQWTQDLSFVLCGNELMETTMSYDSLVTLPNSANTCKINDTCYKRNISEKKIVIVELVGAKSVVVSLCFRKELKILIAT